MRYAIYIEKDSDSDYGVTIPDLPGCFSAGSTIVKAILNAEEAILTHIEGMLMDDELIPAPSDIEVLKQKHKTPELTWAICEIDTSKLSDKVRRINITIPEKLLSKIDSCAKNEGETRSGLIAHAALEYISRHA